MTTHAAPYADLINMAAGGGDDQNRLNIAGREALADWTAPPPDRTALGDLASVFDSDERAARTGQKLLTWPSQADPTRIRMPDPGSAGVRSVLQSPQVAPPQNTA